MIKQTVLDRITQALDTVNYNHDTGAYAISAKYWENLEPDTYNFYSSLPALKRSLIAEIVRRWD